MISCRTWGHNRRLRASVWRYSVRDEQLPVGVGQSLLLNQMLTGAMTTLLAPLEGGHRARIIGSATQLILTFRCAEIATGELMRVFRRATVGATVTVCVVVATPARVVLRVCFLRKDSHRVCLQTKSTRTAISAGDRALTTRCTSTTR